MKKLAIKFLLIAFNFLFKGIDKTPFSAVLDWMRNFFQRSVNVLTDDDKDNKAQLERLWKEECDLLAIAGVRTAIDAMENDQIPDEEQQVALSAAKILEAYLIKKVQDEN